MITSPGGRQLLAHGVGGRQDLPIPFAYAVVGAGVALVVSFLALGLLWRESRLDGADGGLPLPGGLARALDSRGLRAALRVVGLVATAYVLVAAVLGPDVADNPTAYVVFILLWIGLIPASVLLGPVWRWLNPLRTVHLGIARLLGGPPEQGLLTLSPRVGYRPAAIGLFAFVWLELIAPDRSSLPVLRTWFSLYAVVHLMCATLFGSRWFDRGDAFEVWSWMWSRFSVVGRRRDGVLVLRSPLDGVAAIAPQPGLVATVCIALGSTAYDGLSTSPRWTGWVQSSGHASTVATAGLLGVIAFVAVVFSLATLASGRLARLGPAGRVLPGQLAHSLVPIALGYVVAHYYSALVLYGQQALILLSDPLVDGSDVLGLSGRSIDSRLITKTSVATLQVVSVVAGHLVGVVLAHDRSVRLMPRRYAVLGQVPLLVAMVAYTVGGLLLLFSG